MAKVPKFLLRKLYLKDSLKNWPTGKVRGFQFILKNTLASATLLAPPSLKVDGVMLPPACVVASLAGVELKASDISTAKPVEFKKGTEIVVKVSKAGGLAPGKHKIDIASRCKEYGELQFDFEDELK